MKTQFFFAFLLLMALAVAKAQPVANFSPTYYTDEDIRMASSYARVLTMLKANGYTISQEKYSTLEEGESAYGYKEFFAGNDYKIVAISNDANVTDIDLFVYDEDESDYTSDTKASEVAIVNFHPLSTREMRIEIKNVSSDTPDDESTCRYVVAYK